MLRTSGLSQILQPRREKQKLVVPTRVRLLSGIIKLYLRLFYGVPPPRTWTLNEDQLGEMVVQLSNKAFHSLMKQTNLTHEIKNGNVTDITQVNCM